MSGVGAVRASGSVFATAAAAASPPASARVTTSRTSVLKLAGGATRSLADHGNGEAAAAKALADSPEAPAPEARTAPTPDTLMRDQQQ